MSNEIDRRVVEMEFRNQQFEKNAEKTRQTLEKLEESLDFEHGVSKSLDIISSKFTDMGIVGQRVLTNLTDSAYKMGVSLVKSLTTDQITAGFSEYELKMGAMQTIISATGKSAKEVEKYLDDLNEYADRTIYSFSDMKQNIGQFTNAGVELGLAVDAIKGVANLAAVSGQGATQASHAMYNFAQALSTGYVGLLDWKSIKTANMDTLEFKQTLLDTAVELGTVTKVGNQYVSTTKNMHGRVSEAFDAVKGFTDNLSYQWLTTDVLIKTLGKYTDETTELGKKAYKAATQIKTFSHMMDTLKESAGSGWATSMELIFGDYEEAIKLWTGLFDRIDAWVSGFSDKRNDILKAWAGFGGRDEMVSALYNVLDALEAITKPMSRALDKLLEYNKGWRYLETISDTINLGPASNVIYETMVKASRGINSFTKSLIPSEKTLRSMTDILAGAFAIIRDVISIAMPVIGFVGKVIKILSPLLKILLAIGGVVGNVILQISNAIRGTLNLGPAAKNINEFLDRMYDAVNTFADNVVDKIYTIPDLFANVLANLKNLKMPDFAKIGKGLVEGLTNAIKNFREKRTLGSFFEGFFNTESVKEAGEVIKGIFDNIVNNTKNFVNNLRESLLKLGPVGEFIVSAFDLVVEIVSEVLDSLKKMIPALNNTLGKSANKLTDFFSEIKIKDVIDIARIAGFIMSMAKLRSALHKVSDIAEEAKHVLEATGKTIENFGKAVTNIGKGVSLALKAEAFKNIAFGLGVVISSVIALSTVDPASLENAVNAFLKITTITAALVIVIDNLREHSLNAVTSGKAMASALSRAIKVMSASFAATSVLAGLSMFIGSVSILITSLAFSIEKLGAMKYEDLQKGVDIISTVLTRIGGLVAAVGGVLVVLALIDKIPTKGAGIGIFKIASSLTSLAMGLAAMAIPVMLFGKMKTETLSKGLKAVAEMMGMVTLSFVALSVVTKFIPNAAKNLSAISLVLFSFSASLMSLVLPIFALGSMKPEVVAQGLSTLGSVVGTLAGTMISLGVAMKIMGKSSSAITKMSLAFGVLAASVAVIALIAPVIINQADNVKRAVVKLIDITVDAIVDSADKIIDGALELIAKVLARIIGYLPLILVQLETILTQLVDWVISYVPELSDKLGRAIGLFVKEFANSLRKNISAGDLLVTLSAIMTITLIIKRFAKLKDDIKEAIPAFVMMTAVMVAIGATIAAIVKSGVEGTAALGVAAGIGLLMKTVSNVMGDLTKILPEFDNIKGGQIMKMLTSLVVIMAPIAVFFAAMKTFDLDPDAIVKYSVALSISLVSLTPVIKALGGLSSSTSKKIKVSQLMGMFGEIALVTAALASIISVLTALDLDPGQMAKYSAALSIAFLGISPMIVALSKVQKYAAKASGLSNMVGVLIEVGGIAAILATTFGVFTGLNLDPVKMAGYAIALSTAFLGISPMLLALAVVNKASVKMKSLKPMIGILISVGGIATILAGVFGLMTLFEVDPNSVVKYSEGLAVAMTGLIPFVLAMGALMAIFSKLKIDPASAFMAGLVVTAVVAVAIVIFTALAALLGGIDMLTGGGFLQTLEASVPIFQTIGEALGALIGGLLGGIGGSTLSSFAKTAQPFFDAISALPSDFGDKMKALGEGFLALTAAGFVGAITDMFTIFTGEGSLASLGKDLAEFAPYLSIFVQNFPDITSDKATAIKRVAESMGALVNAMPKKGGVVQWWTGEVDMDEFTRNIGLMGVGIAAFDVATRGLSYDSIENATRCGQMLTTLAGAMPKTGGFVQWWGGEVDMAGFAKNLPALGTALVDFNNAVTKEGKSLLNQESLDIATNAAMMLANLNDHLPNTGGNLQKWTGVKDLQSFADKLPNLGEMIVAFNDAVTANGSSKINADSVNLALWVAQAIANLQNNLPNSGGVAQWFTGFKDLGNFSDSMSNLGGAIATFALTASGINEQQVKKAVNAILDIIHIQNELYNYGESDIVPGQGYFTFWEDSARMQAFASNIPRLGEGLHKLSEYIDATDFDAINATTGALEALGVLAKLANGLGDDASKIFDNIYNGLAQGIEDERMMDIISSSVSIVIGNVANMLIKNPWDKNSKFYIAGTYVTQGFANGMKADSGLQQVKSAAETIANTAFAAIQKTADEHSPSKRAMGDGGNVTKGFAIGLLSEASSVRNSSELMTQEAFNAMNDGLSKIYTLMASGIDFEPTISPVVDLSNVRKSASDINTLFSESRIGLSGIAGIETSIKLSRNLKMESPDPVKPTDLSKVTDGINKVGQKLSDMERAIGKMQVVLDTGALVGGMTNPLMRSMNAQEKRISRGVISSKLR